MSNYGRLIGLMAPFLAMGIEPPVYRKTEFERRLSSASWTEIVNEYNLINQKKSKLSRSQRDLVQGHVEWLVAKGHLLKMDDGSVAVEIKVVNP